MRQLRGTFALIVTLCLAASSWSFAHAQDPDYQYFPETGHSVQNEFLHFYRAIPDPTTIYGYPITEAFANRDGRIVQYFQRARFELHAELPAGGQVVLTNIGRELYVPGVQLSTTSPFACREYQQTNFSVCFAFLEYFDQNGGVAQFGYPISPFEYHDGIIVQYFEKVRMEWRPSQPEGQRVVLTDLGRIYFDKAREDLGLLTAVPPSAESNAPSSVISVKVNAFVWKALTQPNDRQLLFVIAQDQRGAALANAICITNVHWPDGHDESISGQTNSAGVAIMSLNVVNQPFSNLVLIDVSCGYNRLTGGITTSFRVWY